MKYEKRLTCFIDLLGFKGAIQQSLVEPEVADRLFVLLDEFRDGGLERAIYSEVPFLGEDGPKTCGEYYGDKLLESSDPNYGLTATQFSDSFVLSVPAGNQVSCLMLIKALRIIHIQFFYSIGMLMRGGIAVGNLVHQRGGALYGPAMNEAYQLESNCAVYSRVVASEEASQLIDKSTMDTPLARNFFKGFDGFTSFDLISIYECPGSFQKDIKKLESQLLLVEKDILANAKAAHPKIAYLISRWESVKSGIGLPAE